VVAVGAGPASVTDTLPRFNAVAVLAARLGHTLVTLDARPTLSAPATTRNMLASLLMMLMIIVNLYGALRNKRLYTVLRVPVHCKEEYLECWSEEAGAERWIAKMVG